MFGFGSKSKKARKEIEGILQELQLYMENNYRDLAKDAFKNAESKTLEYHDSGYLSDRDYEALLPRISHYKQKMVNYHH